MYGSIEHKDTKVKERKSHTKENVDIKLNKNICGIFLLSGA